MGSSSSRGVFLSATSFYAFAFGWSPVPLCLSLLIGPPCPSLFSLLIDPRAGRIQVALSPVPASSGKGKSELANGKGAVSMWDRSMYLLGNYLADDPGRVVRRSTPLIGKMDYLHVWTICMFGLFACLDYLPVWTICMFGLFACLDYLPYWDTCTYRTHIATPLKMDHVGHVATLHLENPTLQPHASRRCKGPLPPLQRL